MPPSNCRLFLHLRRAIGRIVGSSQGGVVRRSIPVRPNTRRTVVRTMRSRSLLFLRVLAPSTGAEPPQTVAETSNYKATSRHADVVAFCETLAKRSPAVRLQTMGTSFEGRKLPLLIIADPPVTTPAEA